MAAQPWCVVAGQTEAEADEQTTLVTLFTLTMHARNYQQPAAQRQVMRVLLMPPV